MKPSDSDILGMSLPFLHMPNQFTVPQFLDIEDKIIGPITVRQFLIMLVAVLISAVLYRILTFTFFVISAFVVMSAGGIVAFLRVNGMPFHFFLINLLQTLRKPKKRVWNKTLSLKDVRAYLSEVIPNLPPKVLRKERPPEARLKELALVVNTGGAYSPDEE